MPKSKKKPPGPVALPDELVGHTGLWRNKIAKRLKIDPERPIYREEDAVIGGMRRYHHRPLTSYRLPGNKGTLTITTDEMEAKSWNRIKGKKNAYSPIIKDVFDIKLLNSDQKYWGIHHENLWYPPPQDWHLFIDTFFRWKAMGDTALKPAKPEDLAGFFHWLSRPEEADSKAHRKGGQAFVMPFQMKKKQDNKIARVRKEILDDPGLEAKVKWAKSALNFLKRYNIKHRDLDPSNLAKTAKGRTVVTNIAESRSKGKKTGRTGRVKAAGAPTRESGMPRSTFGTSPFGPGKAPNPLHTFQAIQKLVAPEEPTLQTVQMFSSNSRLTYGLVHLDPQMRMTVLEAAYHIGVPVRDVESGIKKLEKLAKKHGDKAYKLYSAVVDKVRDVSATAVYAVKILDPKVTTPGLVQMIDNLHDFASPNVRQALCTAASGHQVDTDPSLTETIIAGLEELSGVPEFEPLVAAMVKVLARMSVDEALSVLGIDVEVARDPSALKKAHREASLKSHPDRGGSTAEMQKVNEAVEVLKKGPLGPSKSELKDRRAEQAKAAKKAVEMANNAGDQIEKMLNPEDFSAHFEAHTGKKFKHKIERYESKTYITLPGGDTIEPKMYKGHKMTWTSEDGETIFELRLRLMEQWYRNVNLLGGGDAILAYDMYLDQDIIHNNKKSKFKQREWSFTNKQKDFLDPDSVFPSKKIKSMVKGKDKKRKFSKRDMLLGLNKYLNAKVDQGGGGQVWAFIPVGPPQEDPAWAQYPKAIKETNHDRIVVAMWRSPMGRNYASWSVHSIQGPYVPKKGREKMKNIKAHAQETEELMVALKAMQKKAANETDVRKVKSLVEKAFDDASPDGNS